ncbi:MAG: TIGR03936 family radical SAM-associated protein, partial [Lachnospiraceae bacterium]|nr:TIGR03936 family radical SAM-associated protein [Lachnospiraceae bacterium]
MKLRIKFRKYGVLKFIGHLDVMRFFQKALRRADIDVAYTTGFSPHQIMSFAAPLGIGLESNGEYVDIEVNTPIASREFIDSFNACSAEGIEVTDVRLLPEKTANAMASVAAAEYRV